MKLGTRMQVLNANTAAMFEGHNPIIAPSKNRRGDMHVFSSFENFGKIQMHFLCSQTESFRNQKGHTLLFELSNFVYFITRLSNLIHY